MRTLTTRIGGFKFVIETNGTQVIGEFDPESGDGMTLPYELRSCWTNNNGQTMGILAAAVSSVEDLIQRVDYVATDHSITGIRHCECDQCKLSDALFDRQFAKRSAV